MLSKSQIKRGIRGMPLSNSILSELKCNLDNYNEVVSITHEGREMSNKSKYISYVDVYDNDTHSVVVKNYDESCDLENVLLARKLCKMDQYIVGNRMVGCTLIMDHMDGTLDSLRNVISRHLIKRFEGWAIDLIRELNRTDTIMPDFKPANVGYTYREGVYEFYVIDIDEISVSTAPISVVSSFSIGHHNVINEVCETPSFRRQATMCAIGLTVTWMLCYLYKTKLPSYFYLYTGDISSEDLTTALLKRSEQREEMLNDINYIYRGCIVDWRTLVLTPPSNYGDIPLI